MAIEAVNNITGVVSPPEPVQVAAKPADFSALVTDAMGELNTNLKESEAILQKMALGETVSAHEVMLTIGKAKSQMRLAVEVRNKLLESYQELMRMQV